MSVTISDVNNLAELMSAIDAINAAPDAVLWYRGHRSTGYKLLPSLLRERRSPEEIIERERRLITRFRQRSIAYWPAGYGQESWDQLFAMQHYGIPTRLLDWSENAMVAVYFALNGSEPTDPLPNTPRLWCLDPVKWNRGTRHLSSLENEPHILTTSDDEADAYEPLAKRPRVKDPVALFGTHNSQRIVAQRGTFVIWGGERVSMEDYADQHGISIIGFDLQGEIDQWLRQLYRVGISETSVFPELTSLAVELTRNEGWRS